jgi:hypothetical protein
MFFSSLWIGFAICVGVFAHVRRNRNGFGWFALAILISPLISFLLLLILHVHEPVDWPIHQIDKDKLRITHALIFLPAILAIVVIAAALIIASSAPQQTETTSKSATDSSASILSRYTKLEYVIFVGRHPVCKNPSDAYSRSAAYAWAKEFENAIEKLTLPRGADAARIAAIAADFDRKYGRCRFVQNGMTDITETRYIRNEYAVDASDPKSHVQVNDGRGDVSIVVPVIFPEGVYYAVVAPDTILSWTDHLTLDTPEGNPMVAAIRTRCEFDTWKNGTCIESAVVQGQLGRNHGY